MWNSDSSLLAVWSEDVAQNGSSDLEIGCSCKYKVKYAIMLCCCELLIVVYELQCTYGQLTIIIGTVNSASLPLH